MKLTVKLYATLGGLPSGRQQEQPGRARRSPEGASVSEVLAPFALPPRLTHLVLVNGVFIPPEERAGSLLKDGDTLAVWPPIAGG
jgi:sulfur carrier protein ThiS